MTEAALSSHK